MRKTFKRTFSLLFASVFLAAGIVACGPAETSSSSGQSGTNSEEHAHVLTHGFLQRLRVAKRTEISSIGDAMSAENIFPTGRVRRRFRRTRS